jgi:hypothetical protein
MDSILLPQVPLPAAFDKAERTNSGPAAIGVVDSERLISIGAPYQEIAMPPLPMAKLGEAQKPGVVALTYFVSCLPRHNLNCH